MQDRLNRRDLEHSETGRQPSAANDCNGRIQAQTTVCWHATLARLHKNKKTAFIAVTTGYMVKERRRNTVRRAVVDGDELM